jgi:Transcriptional regulator, AbiEi antitoxin
MVNLSPLTYPQCAVPASVRPPARASLIGMILALSDAIQALLDQQSGVISRRQAAENGLTGAAIDNQLRSGRWQRMRQGVYATFTGPPDRAAQLWAVVLRAGPDAALSHWTAAELFGLTDRPSSLVHVTVPYGRQVSPIGGVIVHHSARAARARHPVLQPPRTRIEDTVLDLTQATDSFDQAFNWLSRAIGRRLTTQAHLRIALDARARVRWRTDLVVALGDVAEGILSPLERRYVYGVERAHGLPPANRQVKIVAGGRTRYLDNLYEQAQLAVELDGRAAHPPEQRWADSHRDNTHAALGILTLRYNLHDCTTGACATAAQIAGLLEMRGMTAPLHPCGPSCTALSERVP